jgi:membrane protein required for colicin V production
MLPHEVTPLYEKTGDLRFSFSLTCKLLRIILIIWYFHIIGKRLQAMHWLDIVTISVLVISFVYSLTRGLVRELFSLISFVLAAVLAARYCDLGHKFLAPYLNAPLINNTLGFITIFIVVSFVGNLIGKQISKSIKSAAISPVDRFFGGVLGLIKGGVVISLVLLLIILFIPQGPKKVANTKVANLLTPVSCQLSRLLPPGLKQRFHKRVKKKHTKPSPRDKSALKQDQKKLKQIIRDNL